MDTWVQLIGSLGFPIVACICMALYVKHVTDKHTEETSKLNEQHTTIMLAYKDEIKDAINNNTLVMQQLCNRLEKGGNINEIK